MPGPSRIRSVFGHRRGGRVFRRRPIGSRVVLAFVPITLAALSTTALFARQVARPELPAPPAPFRTAEDEVLANLRAQPVGPVTLDALDYPESFLRRVADRIIRASYQQRYRRVEATPEPKGLTPPPPPDDPVLVEIFHRPADEAELGRWRAFPVGVPEVRSFRAPIVEDALGPVPLRASDAGYSEAERRAALIVAQHLARDGIAATLVRVLAELGPSSFTSPTPDQLRRIMAIGLPVDLLRGVVLPEQAEASAEKVVAWAAGRLNAGASPDEAARTAAALPYSFRPTVPGFRLAGEAGEHSIELVRAHANADRLIGGLGGGGAYDLLRQLFWPLPGSSFRVHIREAHAEALQRALGGWVTGDPARVRIIAEPVPMAQWAQDNGKPGFIIDSEGVRTRATICPRYSGRGEAPLNFMPGESSAIRSFAATGERVIQSPLMFAGGNVILARDPGTNRRLLFIGEAEIARNHALGLTRPQILDAFKAEFAADHVEVLPAVSFHIDLEVTFRVIDGRLTAFVNDSRAGARHVLACAADALRAAGIVRPDEARALREHALADRLDIVVTALSQVLVPAVGADGVLPADFARHFADGDADWAAANLRRILLAIDIASASSREIQPKDLDIPTAVYLESLRRAEADRLALRQQLGALGLPVVLVPGISAEGLSLAPLNGIHAPGLYLMPASGGLFEPFDLAAKNVLQGAMGPSVSIVPIRSAETQQREGGVHCAISAYPSAP